jgi:hypothetical protein
MIPARERGAPSGWSRAQVRHVGLDGAADVAGKIVAPQAVGDALGGHDLAAGEQQDGQDSTLTATAEIDLGVAVAGVEPAEYPDGAPSCARHPTSRSPGIEGRGGPASVRSVSATGAGRPERGEQFPGQPEVRIRLAWRVGG